MVKMVMQILDIDGVNSGTDDMNSVADMVVQIYGMPRKIVL